jgi:hypothetical protein
MANSPEQFALQIRAALDKYQRIVTKAKIRLD